MARSKLIYAGGLKSISLGDMDKWMTERMEEELGRGGSVTLANAYKSVPWLFRAVALRANNMSQLPFHIMDGDTEIASSDDWEQRPDSLEWFEDPEGMLWMIEASRTLAGCAYFGKLHNRYYDNMGAPSELKYFVTSTIEPKIDEKQGLTGFERRLGSGPPQQWATEDILYFWHPDPRVEMGPPTAWPAQAALAASGVLLNLDQFVAQFFSHGAIKATLLTAPKGTMQPARDRLKAWWNNVFKGIGGAWQTEIVEADSITPVVIGEGVKELENESLTSQKREDIAAALDIPQTILFSGSASGIGGGGVSEADDLRFATQFIVPASRWIARTLNKQLFADMELQLKFETESLKVFQEDETSRSSSAVNLANMLSTLKDPDERKAIFMMLGYDLSPDVEKLLFKPQPEPPAPPKVTIIPNAPPPQLGPGNGNGQEPPANEPPPDENAAKALEREQFKTWAKKRIKAGKALDGFVFNALDTDEQAQAIAEARGSDKPSPFQEYRIRLAGLQGRVDGASQTSVG